MGHGDGLEEREGGGAVTTAEGGANKYWVCVTFVAFLSHVLSKCIFVLAATVEQRGSRISNQSVSIISANVQVAKHLNHSTKFIFKIFFHQIIFDFNWFSDLGVKIPTFNDVGISD